MKKNRGILLYIFLTFFIIAGCSNQTAASEDAAQVEALQRQVKELEEKNDHHETHIQYLEEELDTHKKLIDKGIPYFNENELLELARSQWQYQIEVNGQAISSDGEMEVDKTQVHISYSERVSSTILPEEFFANGPISGEYPDHLKFVDIQPKEIKRLDGTVVTACVYVFENLSEDTSIPIEVSDELKERLGLQTNRIHIHVK